MIPLMGIRRITLLTVLGRIHSDIVRIWNIKVSAYFWFAEAVTDGRFQDPDEVIAPILSWILR
jgi:hypothetical protein